MWIAVLAMLIPISFVVLLMGLIRIWSFGAPRRERKIPNYSLHVMRDVPPKFLVPKQSQAPSRPTGYSNQATTSGTQLEDTSARSYVVYDSSASTIKKVGVHYYEPGSRAVPYTPQSSRATGSDSQWNLDAILLRNNDTFAERGFYPIWNIQTKIIINKIL